MRSKGTALAEKDGKTSIQVIERMMQLLDALAAQPGQTSLKILAQTTGLHPSTAHRILGVMVDSGFAERVETGSYRLGIRLMELGNLVKNRINVRHAALPFMQQLQQDLGETVNLSIRQNDEVVYVERTTGNRGMMRVVQVEGTRAPLHITAVGKVFLAEDPPGERSAYARRTKLPRCTENTITSEQRLIEETDRVRRVGYAFDNEEAEKGVSCIGAGIRDDQGRLVAGLSLSAPVDRFDKEWVSKVKETTERISCALGYRAARKPQ